MEEEKKQIVLEIVVALEAVCSERVAEMHVYYRSQWAAANVAVVVHWSKAAARYVHWWSFGK